MVNVPLCGRAPTAVVCSSSDIGRFCSGLLFSRQLDRQGTQTVGLRAIWPSAISIAAFVVLAGIALVVPGAFKALTPGWPVYLYSAGVITALSLATGFGCSLRFSGGQHTTRGCLAPMNLHRTSEQALPGS